MNAGKLTTEEIKRLFPNASPSLFKANACEQNPDVQKPVYDRETLDLMRRNITLGIRPTTDEAKLNKTEKAYLKWAESLGALWVGCQCITLKIGDDCRFTMDFWILDEQGLRAVDVKGFQRDDALVKIKVAARLFPWIRFLIARRNGLVWEHTEIKP